MDGVAWPDICFYCDFLARKLAIINKHVDQSLTRNAELEVIIDRMLRNTCENTFNRSTIDPRKPVKRVTTHLQYLWRATLELEKVLSYQLSSSPLPSFR